MGPTARTTREPRTMLDATPHIIRVLLHDGELSEEALHRAEAAHPSGGPQLLAGLVELGLTTDRSVAAARARVCEHPFVDVEKFDVELRNALLLPRRFAERFSAFPLFVVDGVATVAVADPLDLQAIDQIRQITGCEIEPVVAEPTRISELIMRAYALIGVSDQENSSAAGAAADLGDADEPLVVAVNHVLMSAADQGASDIHINPDEAALHLRFRIDGVLKSQQGPPASVHAAIVQRLKVMAKLDLTESRRPQDGKFRFRHRGQPIDVRLSTVPTVHGENVVMRLLRSTAAFGSFADLGMPAEVCAWYEAATRRPHGMILITGPTGSGKTTTLYTALHNINGPDLNIMTIEDPVEYRLPLVRQIQVNTELDLTFARALRSILRQDPDVVLVGEIRDPETARIAAQAALTGHLVFSTLHTNDAVACVTRLRDLDVPPYAINGGLLGAIGQRLVRRLCPDCAAAHRPTEADAVGLGMDVGSLPAGAYRRAVGCNACGGSGYRGRCGVYEAMVLNRDIRALIERAAGEAEVREVARAAGMSTMFDDGMTKAAMGITSLGEVAALAGEVHGSVRGAGPVRSAA